MEGPNSFNELKKYIRQDLGYVNGKTIRSFLSRYLFEPGFKYIVWLRLTRFLYLTKHKILFGLSRMFLKHYGYKYHFDISYRAQIGPGLTIAHFGFIIVMSNDIIGDNCTLRPGVVFGKKLTADTGGANVGNNVDFGVGSKIIGEVQVGDNVTVGANAVITKDVPSNTVVGGVPAKIIKWKETEQWQRF